MAKNQHYTEYLAGKGWHKRRRKALIRTKTCRRCGSRRELQVHHLTYERLGKELPRDLIVLCRKCHEEAHARMSEPRFDSALETTARRLAALG